MSRTTVAPEPTDRATFGRAKVASSENLLVITAPGARNRAWLIAAVLYGIPWLTFVLIVSVWYIGWGAPEDFIVRLLLWAVTVLLTIAMHVLALLSIWGAMYAASGTETLTVDPKQITLVRRAWRFPITLHIGRRIIERATPLAERPGKMAHPKVEVKAWRSAIRFGAGLDAEEAEECMRLINERFERDEAARHALTPDDAGDTIAPTRTDGSASESKATTGTSRATLGLSQRAGTVKARGVQWFRRSPQQPRSERRKAK